MPDMHRSDQSDYLAGLAGHGGETVHPVQPYQAVKTYKCPRCETAIEPGVGHLVIIPEDAPDLRRHWHRGCWFKERKRLGYHRQS